MTSLDGTTPLLENFSNPISGCEQQISFFSWNILAQHLFDEDRSTDYPHIKPETPTEWNERLPMILNGIVSAGADVVCLQEVAFTAFENDLLPALHSEGYEGVMQNDPKRADTHLHGLATFWKKSCFSMQSLANRSRTMTVILSEKADASDDNNRRRLFAVVNCHLEGDPTKSIARVKQLQKTLRETSTKYSHNALVLCGDLNCELQSSACAAYLSFGSCPPGGVVLEWGTPVPAEVSDIPSHPYNLSSAYPAQLGRDDPTEHFTYAADPGHPVPGLDQIWHTSDSLRCVALRQLFETDDRRRTILETGLPNAFHPSDHIAIGAAFQWTDGELKDLRQGNEKESRPSNWDPLVEASELLNACPFDSDRQREEFEYIASDVPNLPPRGKPAPEQLAEIKERRARKERLFAEFSEETTQVLQQVLKLRKEASRLRN